jgi:acetyltransferase-like isoleucine patch superfamily enzyme
VKIGDYNWLGAETMVMKGTKTPRHVIVGARSILNKRYRIPECSCLMAVGSNEIVSEGYVRDWKNLAEKMSSRKIDDIEKVKKELDIIV